MSEPGSVDSAAAASFRWEPVENAHVLCESLLFTVCRQVPDNIRNFRLDAQWIESACRTPAAVSDYAANNAFKSQLVSQCENAVSRETKCTKDYELLRATHRDLKGDAASALWNQERGESCAPFEALEIALSKDASTFYVGAILPTMNHVTPDTDSTEVRSAFFENLMISDGAELMRIQEHANAPDGLVLGFRNLVKNWILKPFERETPVYLTIAAAHYLGGAKAAAGENITKSVAILDTITTFTWPVPVLISPHSDARHGCKLEVIDKPEGNCRARIENTKRRLILQSMKLIQKLRARSSEIDVTPLTEPIIVVCASGSQATNGELIRYPEVPSIPVVPNSRTSSEAGGGRNRGQVHVINAGEEPIFVSTAPSPAGASATLDCLATQTDPASQPEPFCYKLNGNVLGILPQEDQPFAQYLSDVAVGITYRPNEKTSTLIFRADNQKSAQTTLEWR